MIDTRKYNTQKELEKAMIDEHNRAELTLLNKKLLRVRLAISRLQNRKKFLESEKLRLEYLISKYESETEENNGETNEAIEE